MKRSVLGVVVLVLLFGGNSARADELEGILNGIKIADKPVLLVVGMKGCPWCKKQATVLQNADFSSCLYLESKEKAVAKHFHVNGFPTLILFKKGKEVKRHGGYLDVKGLKKFLGVSSAFRP